MKLHPLFGVLYAMIATLIWWSVDADLTDFALVYIGLLALLFAAHFAYVNDLKRSETHDDNDNDNDIDWDY